MDLLSSSPISPELLSQLLNQTISWAIPISSHCVTSPSTITGHCNITKVTSAESFDGPFSVQLFVGGRSGVSAAVTLSAEAPSPLDSDNPLVLFLPFDLRDPEAVSTDRSRVWNVTSPHLILTMPPSYPGENYSSFMYQKTKAQRLHI